MFAIDDAFIDNERPLNFITCTRASLGCEGGCVIGVPDCHTLDEAYERSGLLPSLALQRYMCGLQCSTYALLEESMTYGKM